MMSITKQNGDVVRGIDALQFQGERAHGQLPATQSGLQALTATLRAKYGVDSVVALSVGLGAEHAATCLR